jgi:hypothetical protein
MPATKLRREQLNVSLNDLLWLDRQKVGGNVRKLSADVGEDIKLETNNGGVYLLLKGDASGDIKISGTRTIVEFFNAIKFQHSTTPNIGLNFSFNSTNFEFQIYADSELNNLIIGGKKISLYSLGSALEVSNDGIQNYVKVNNKLGVGVVPSYTLDVNGDIRAFGDLLSSKTSAVNIGALTNQPVKILTNNTERVIINEYGLGIGTTPSDRLHIKGGKITIESFIGVNILIKSYNSEIQFKEDFGSYFGRFQRNGDTNSASSFYTYIGNGAQHVNGADEYTFYVDNQFHNPVVFTLNTHGWKFISGPSGSTGNRTLTEVARLTWDGKLGLGLVPTYKLDVNGDIRCFGDLLSSKTGTVNIGTLTNQAVQIITNNTARVIIPTSGYIDFKLPVKMNEGIVVDWEKREKLQILNQDLSNYWVQYNSADHGVNGWGSWNPSQVIGKVFRFMDTGQVIVLLNGQVLTEGSVINGNITGGDYVFVNAVNSPITNGKALVLAEQPQTGDVVRVVGFFSVYEY